ncbi:hypothetical protein C8Q72DRAFT_651482 [Fomitopsis betulina]|nr:hypothetical protein C8Q72DRAFT_651482 [Fomitopsis betulina]
MPVNITWSDPNTYKNQPEKKQQIETDVQTASQTTAAEKKGATKAVIRGGAHESKSDKKEHVTVNYEKSNGDHVTTKHVAGTGRPSRPCYVSI